MGKLSLKLPIRLLLFPYAVVETEPVVCVPSSCLLIILIKREDMRVSSIVEYDQSLLSVLRVGKGVFFFFFVERVGTCRGVCAGGEMGDGERWGPRTPTDHARKKGEGNEVKRRERMKKGRRKGGKRRRK